MIHDHIEIDIHKCSVFILGDPDSVFEHITAVLLEHDLWCCILQCIMDTIKVEPDSEDETHRSDVDIAKVDTKRTFVEVKCEIEVGQFQKL